MTASEPAFLAGGGQMGARIRAHDWAATPLGPPEAWPPALQALTGVMLASTQPMFIVWGPQRTTLYNDAYGEILAAKHPALAEPFERIWHEIWDRDLAPIVRRAYAGEALHMDDIPLVMTRRGYPEETHFSFSYTPVRDADGIVQGFFCPCLETTAQVLEERRARIRADLTERLRLPHGPDDLALHAAALLARHLRAGQAAFAEIDEAGEHAMIARDWNDGSMASNAGRHRLQDFGPAFIDDLRRGRTVAIGDVRDDPRTATPEALATFARRGLRAFLDVPCLRRGRLVAVLAVHAAEPRRWHPADIALAEEVAQRLYDAIDRARAEAAQQASEARYRRLFDAIDEGFCINEFRFDPLDGRADYRVLEANPAFYARTGFPPDILGRWLREAAPDLEEHWYEIYGRVAQTREPVRFQRKSDMLGRWFDVYAFPIDDPQDHRIAVLFNDITERKRGEEHARMLLGEVNHRAKNMLSLVLAIARASAGEGGQGVPPGEGGQGFPPGEGGQRFVETFRRRVMALSANQDLLISRNWAGVWLHDLARAQLAPFEDGSGRRIVLDGPAVVLSSGAAETIGMALHELATNAGKYGALSVPRGSVRIAWRAVSDPARGARFVITWRETGGPPVAPPTRKGFGTRVIDAMARSNLAAEVVLRYAPDGLVWELDAPAARCLEAGGAPGDGAPPPPPPAPAPAEAASARAGRILVVEDEALIALDLAGELLAAGHEVVGPAASVRAALALIETEGCDAAVLDVNLGKETSAAVAEALAARGIPFVAVTGYSREQLPRAMAHVRLFPKPVQVGPLLAALSGRA